MGSSKAVLEHYEVHTEVLEEIRVCACADFQDGSLAPLKGDVHDVVVLPFDVQNNEDFPLEKVESNVRKSGSSPDVDHQAVLVSRPIKDVSDSEIFDLHSHPRFVDFRKMPIPILQCFFWPDRWKVLCVCIFLNCTRRVQVERVVWKFFERFPTPESLLTASDEEVQDIVKPLGFYKRRTTSLKRMSEDFVSRNWKIPEDLRSVGVYAATCYRMMFLFELGDHAPDDHALVDLYNWMKGLSPRRRTTSNPGKLLPDVRR